MGFIRNRFGWRFRRRFVRSLLCLLRPDLRWIGLLSLNFRHLTDRMLFARRRKQKDAERNSDDALAKERTHNALAQLSVSAVARKTKAHRSDMAQMSYATNETNETHKS